MLYWFSVAIVPLILGFVAGRQAYTVHRLKGNLDRVADLLSDSVKLIAEQNETLDKLNTENTRMLIQYNGLRLRHNTLMLAVGDLGDDRTQHSFYGGGSPLDRAAEVIRNEKIAALQRAYRECVKVDTAIVEPARALEALDRSMVSRMPFRKINVDAEAVSRMIDHNSGDDDGND